jgi:hypothetical protein
LLRSEHCFGLAKNIAATLSDSQRSDCVSTHRGTLGANRASEAFKSIDSPQHLLLRDARILLGKRRVPTTSPYVKNVSRASSVDSH